MPTNRRRILPLLLLLIVIPALAQQGAPDLSGCARIPGASQRLACYDRLAGVNQMPAQSTAAAPSAAQVDPEVAASLDLSPEKTRGFSLADHWELDRQHRRGVFNFRPHHANYMMVTRSAHPKRRPTTITRTSSTTWAAATSPLPTAATGTTTRPCCAGTFRPGAARSSSAGHSRWPATSRAMPSTSPATARA